MRELDRTRRVVDPAKLAVAEYELVAAATGTGDASTVPCTADELRVQRMHGPRSSIKTGPNPMTNARWAAAASDSVVRVTA